MKLLYGKVWRQARTILVLAMPPIVFFLLCPVFFRPLPVLPPQEAENAPQAAVEEVPEAPTAKPAILAIKKYIVQSGDSLSAIAARYNLDVDTLLGANSEAGEIIKPGQELLVLPEKGVLHTVQEGDTLSQVAEMYAVKADAIMRANGKESELLAVGGKLFIPGGKRPQRADTSASRAGTSRIVWPAKGEISSPFGYRWGRLHAGLDIANDLGTPVRAALTGHISYVGWISGYGKTVMIEHIGGYVTLYGHLSGFAVQTGQSIQAGQTIAYMGSTGDSTGPHLHFEVRINGTPVNPLSILP